MWQCGNVECGNVQCGHVASRPLTILGWPAPCFYIACFHKMFTFFFVFIFVFISVFVFVLYDRGRCQIDWPAGGLVTLDSDGDGEEHWKWLWLCKGPINLILSSTFANLNKFHNERMTCMTGKDNYAKDQSNFCSFE